MPGAFVYGRTRMREPPRESASAGERSPRPIEEWRIVVKDRYPAYIDWPTYERIRDIIRDNRAEYMRTKTRGAPRDGDLLLHGIAWCARCGHKMYVRYKGGGEYVCNHLRSHEGLPACQHIRAAHIDAAVADAFLTALAPAELDALSRARRAQQQMDTALRASAERAARAQSDMPPRWPNASSTRSIPTIVSSPRTRASVGSGAERGPGGRGSACPAIRAQAIAQMAMGKALNGKVVSLAGRLPQIWADAATTDAQRKALLRCLVEKVVLDRGEHDVALVRIVWRGGAVTDLEVKDEGQLRRQPHARGGNARSRARPRPRRRA